MAGLDEQRRQQILKALPPPLPYNVVPTRNDLDYLEKRAPIPNKDLPADPRYDPRDEVPGRENARMVTPEEMKTLGAMVQNAQPNTMLQQLGLPAQPPAAPSSSRSQASALTQFLQQLLGKQTQAMPAPNPVAIGIRG
jgi:hypothetical protein